MSTLIQCKLCGERPMEPFETKGGVYYKCSECDGPSTTPGPRLEEELLGD